MLTACLLGFVLGLRHASDPDHVVAVSSIVAQWRRASAASWIGVAWGLGHSMTLLLVGTTIVALRLTIPTRVALSLELIVGLVLVALGVANLWLARRWSEPGDGASAAPVAALGAPLLRALGVGAVHGLAGSAAVALLALTAMPTPAAAVAYLVVFSLGTMAGMLAVSLGLSLPLGFAAGLPGVRRWIVAGSGAVSLCFGVWLVYDIGFVQGLL